MRASAARIGFHHLTVDFGATRALDDVNFTVAPGEIVGLLGHNGAGKSTLINLASGVVQLSSGALSLEGVRIRGKIVPRRASRLGITVIHQDPALAPNLTVLENLFLALPALSHGERLARARSTLRSVGADIDLMLPVGALSLGDRQLVALARGTLAGNMRVLMLDEPTAALGKPETDALHTLIQHLAAQGVAVIYVSHRLPDVLAACTRIVVLRSGRIVADAAASEYTSTSLAQALVPELHAHPFDAAEPGERILSFPLTEMTITARSGEVVGIFGMAGGEQFSIAAQIAGAHHTPYSYRLNGVETRMRTPAQAIHNGVFFVPPDRENDALVSSATALSNVMLPWYSEYAHGGWWVSGRTGNSVYDAARRKLDIRGPAAHAEISQFSGGNRQKHVLARWLYTTSCTLLVLAQPTQGVDVGAKLDIVHAVRKIAASGVAVLVCSSESDEIASVCDRAYVLRNDGVRQVPRSPDFTEHLLAALLGAPKESATGSAQ